VLSFPVPGATSEKFVLALVLLDAFLHGQGHDPPIDACLWQVCSMAVENSAERPVSPVLRSCRGAGSEGQNLAQKATYAVQQKAPNDVSPPLLVGPDW
jgi:hypothetical protein